MYYREVDADSVGTEFSVLKDNKVTVKDTVTKKMMEELEAAGATQPTLTFTAYACQSDNVDTAADAWKKINPGT